jgi:large subunit ribosomal protein L29
MKINDIRGMTTEELNTKLISSKTELFNLRFQHATGNLNNPMMLNTLKKDIAKIKTILTERQLNVHQEQTVKAEKKPVAKATKTTAKSATKAPAKTAAKVEAKAKPKTEKVAVKPAVKKVEAKVKPEVKTAAKPAVKVAKSAAKTTKGA